MRRLVLATLVAGFFIAGGCSEKIEEGPAYEYGLFPRVAHSGFNAGARFQVMFATSAPDPVWTVEDPSIATIAPTEAPVNPSLDTDSLRFALATMTKAGTTRVTMTAGGSTLTSELQVKAYTDEEMALGKTRYETGGPEAGRQSCASCHQKSGGVDHSPLKMAGYDDPTILGVIENATYPARASGGSTTSPYAPKGPLSFTGHKWNVTEPEKDGVLAHLRSLPLGRVAPSAADAGPDAD